MQEKNYRSKEPMKDPGQKAKQRFAERSCQQDLGERVSSSHRPYVFRPLTPILELCYHPHLTPLRCLCLFSKRMVGNGRGHERGIAASGWLRLVLQLNGVNMHLEPLLESDANLTDRLKEAIVHRALERGHAAPVGANGRHL